jgi:branched-chain amino acid transport system ATP-binding protein
VIAAAAPLLTVRGLHAYIGTSHILHGVEFDAAPGAVTMLVGRNGVGKTTTLRSIIGLAKASGSVSFLGQEILGLPSHLVARRGIGYVPEDRDVFHGLSVRENLQLAERRGMEPRYDLVHDVFPELRQRARQQAGSLSGGQQQMLSVARVLLNETPLLLIDEPTKGLAPRLVTELVVVLERIAQASTIVMVEQNLAVARRLATTVLVMDHGQIVASGSPDEILADDERVRAYLGVGHDRGEAAD